VIGGEARPCGCCDSRGKKSGASGEKGGALRANGLLLWCASASACLSCLVLLVLRGGRRVLLSTWSQMCFVHMVLGLGLNCCLTGTPVVIRFELSD
jgi:hypothetical protein